MRVALFFDGKNHMKALRRSATNRWIDHGALANWMVERVGGTSLFGAYYYTGVPGPTADTSERHSLSDLLERLDKRPGFFVRRFNRRANSRECPHCNEVVSYTEEKMVDTSLVAEMITYAAADAYDIAVVFSGDQDVAPGLVAVQGLGKRAWVATFGDAGLSRALSRSAWGTINLLDHLEAFSYPDLDAGPGPVSLLSSPPAEMDREMLRELRRAEIHFGDGGGFVGAHYFIHRWKGHQIPDMPEVRRESLQRLLTNGEAEAYTVDGKTALRVSRGENLTESGAASVLMVKSEGSNETFGE